MELEQSFEVEATLERVWEELIDVERVAPCLPGAEVTGSGEGVYEGTFTVKLGPTTAAYVGELEMAEVDRDRHQVRMRAHGQDKRGQGSAEATITSSLSEDGETTRVVVVTDLTLTGRLARFGRGGMIEDVSNRLMSDFVSCLRSSIEGDGSEAGSDGGQAPAEARPIRGLRLMLSVLWTRIKRFFRRLLGRSP